MKERPILFSGPMIRALLDGSKTQTRRIVKIKGSPPSGPFWDHKGYKPVPFCGGWTFGYVETGVPSELAPKFLCPYGVPGDRIWVKETFRKPMNDGDRCEYAADIPNDTYRRTPSIFMPRKLSRITLEITEVRVERLQDISQEDAEAEGIARNLPVPASDWSDGHGWLWHDWQRDPDQEPAFSPKEAYQRLWESINGPGSWQANPWVWVISFRRVRP